MDRELGIRQLNVHCNSQLVANQLTGEYVARDNRKAAYVLEAKLLIQELGSVEVKQIGREQNSHADSFASLATAIKSELRREVVVDYQAGPSIVGKQVMCADQEGEVPSWMTSIMEYLKDGTLSEESKEVMKIRSKAARFWLSPTNKLYRQSYSGPYQHCVNPIDVLSLLWGIHEGCCGGHVGGRRLAHWAMS